MNRSVANHVDCLDYNITLQDRIVVLVLVTPSPPLLLNFIMVRCCQVERVNAQLFQCNTHKQSVSQSRHDEFLLLVPGDVPGVAPGGAELPPPGGADWPDGVSVFPSNLHQGRTEQTDLTTVEVRGVADASSLMP